jgi:hypothetical protein
MQSNEEFGEDIVHIIPLGHEIDRAVKIFEKKIANRAYILATTDTFGKHSEKLVEEQKRYVAVVEERLRQRGILPISKSIDMFEPSEVIRHISAIIVQEKAKKNNIYINISSAGRLTAAAATLTAMAHKVKAYYIEASRYSDNPEDRKAHGISICDEYNPKWIENLPIELPPKQEMEVLKELCRKGRPMTIKDLALHLARKDFPAFKKHREALERTLPRKDPRYGQIINCMMMLNKGILEKLKARGYIRRERRGSNNLVIIEEAGKFIAYFGGEF